MLPRNYRIPGSWQCPVHSVRLRWVPAKSLQLELDISLLSALSTAQSSSEAGDFWLEEDFVFPLWLNSYCGGERWYIPAGTYSLQMTDYGGLVSICLPVQMVCVFAKTERNKGKLWSAKPA